jgi:hypothetical protein
MDSAIRLMSELDELPGGPFKWTTKQVARVYVNTYLCKMNHGRMFEDCLRAIARDDDRDKNYCKLVAYDSYHFKLLCKVLEEVYQDGNP